MEEADGRPGTMALEFGHPDAHQDALAPSLRHTNPSNLGAPGPSHLGTWDRARTTLTIHRSIRSIKEKKNENLPGK
jgi:hypothetical protein